MWRPKVRSGTIQRVSIGLGRALARGDDALETENMCLAGPLHQELPMPCLPSEMKYPCLRPASELAREAVICDDGGRKAWSWVRSGESHGESPALVGRLSRSLRHALFLSFAKSRILPQPPLPKSHAPKWLSARCHASSCSSQSPSYSPSKSQRRPRQPLQRPQLHQRQPRPPATSRQAPDRDPAQRQPAHRQMSTLTSPNSTSVASN